MSVISLRQSSGFSPTALARLTRTVDHDVDQCLASFWCSETKGRDLKERARAPVLVLGEYRKTDHLCCSCLP